MKITNDITYIGVNHRVIDLFEGIIVVENGMAYNSYLIKDDKIAVIFTVDAHFTHEWLDNLEKALDGQKPDYLIIQHMEPDHSANIVNFLKTYPNASVVSNTKAFAMMENFFGADFCEKRIVVSDGETLDLGKHKLTFVFAPMVHWPEVMVTYDSADKVFSPLTVSAGSARLTGKNRGTMKREDIISVSSASTARRFRRCSKRPPRLTLKRSVLFTVPF